MPRLVLTFAPLLLVSTFAAVIRSGGEARAEPEEHVDQRQNADVPKTSQRNTNLRYNAEMSSPVTLAGTFTNATAAHSSGIITTTDCFTDTGGTCMVQQCAAWRGAQCGKSWKCICPEGSCSGADGKCYRQKYESLGKFRIRNAKFPAYYMYVSAYWNGLYVTEQLSPQSDFMIKKMPDESVIMSPLLFPQYVVRTEEDRQCDGDGHNEHCTYSYDPEVTYISGWFTDMSAISASLHLETINHEGQDYVMIANADHPDRYFDTSNFGSTINTGRGDNGLYSYWIFEPPLPFKPPAFRGRRCSFNCGW